MKWTGFIPDNLRRFLRTSKNADILIALAVICLVIMAYTFILPNRNESAAGNAPPEETSSPIAGEDDEQELELRMEQILSKIQGVGNVEVLVTFASGKEIVPATSVDQQSNTTQENGAQSDTSKQTTSITEHSEPVTVSKQGNASPIILKEIMPEVMGVVVVAEGAEDFAVRFQLMRAVQTALDIPESRIDVFPMNEEP